MMRLTLIACGLVAVLATGCGNKSSKRAPEISGLAAVPASAEVVITAEVARVIDAPLVTRAVDALLLKDPELSERWDRLSEVCKLDGKKLQHVVLAIGPKGDGQPGTGPVLMVVTGKLVETELAACVRSMVGQGGGTLTAKDLGGRTLYQAKEGNRTMFFAFGKPDTVVLGANEAFVTEALGTGKKVSESAELMTWIKLVDQKAPVWAAGRVDERVKTGLVRATNGQIKEGPRAMVLSVDPSKGAKLEVGAVMASPADAKALESFAKSQLSLLAMAAQAKSLGTMVDKIAISSDGEVARFKADLDTDEVNLLISVLDGGPDPAQDSPPPAPPTGSGSAGSAAGSAAGTP